MNNISIIKDRCCGCYSCKQTCHKSAIVFKENNEGFYYPEVNQENCVDCGLCLVNCPAFGIETEIDKQNGYAVWAKDQKTLMNSSSGGIFYPLAKFFIDQGGYVCGCINDDQLLPKHVLSNKLEDVLKMSGSKYVESNLDGIFTQVKKELDLGGKVLFTGTPCQVAGLKKFIGKDPINLFTIDIICHGVPSRKLFTSYLSWKESRLKGKIINFKFRSKDKHDWSLTYKLIYFRKKERTEEKMASLDPYYYSFLQGDTYRESCYKCSYSNMSRPSDITIGDFWGIERVYPDLNNIQGVSAVITNSKKGEALFDQVQKEFVVNQVDVNDIKDNNGNLRRPTLRKKIRDEIYVSVLKDGFDKTAKKYMKPKRIFIEKLKDKIPNRMRQKLKKLIKR